MFDPAQSAVACVRAHRAYADRRGAWSAGVRKLIRLRHRFWSMISGSDIKLGARLGANLRLPHPNGVVIHQEAVVGDDCMIMQQVTLGIIEGPAPALGSNVYVGAGAKVLGGVKVGDGARIGANAVVLLDVPPGWTAIGVPARLLPPAELRKQSAP